MLAVLGIHNLAPASDASTSDEELARRAAAGRLDCFELLLKRYRDRVFRICYRCAGNAEDAEDWAQECFVRAFEQLHRFDPSYPFAPWFLRLVSNSCINLAKARARRPHWDGDQDIVEQTPTYEEPLSQLVQTHEEQTILHAVGQLPPDMRVALTLRVVEELSFKEIAQILDVPLQTAATRVRRALEQVRRTLQSEPSAPPVPTPRAALLRKP